MSLFGLAFQKPQLRGWAEPGQGGHAPWSIYTSSLLHRPHPPADSDAAGSYPEGLRTKTLSCGPQTGSSTHLQSGWWLCGLVWGLMLKLSAPQNLRLQKTHSMVGRIADGSQTSCSISLNFSLYQDLGGLRLRYSRIGNLCGEGPQWNMMLVLTEPWCFLYFCLVSF